MDKYGLFSNPPVTALPSWRNTAPPKQLMAVYDWSSSSQAAIYTWAASQKRLAGQIRPLLMSMDGVGTDD